MIEKKKQKNRNLLLEFFRQKRNFTVMKGGKETTISSPIFHSQKELMLTLCQIPDSRFSKPLKNSDPSSISFRSKASLLSIYLSGYKIKTYEKAMSFKRELQKALDQKLNKELKIEIEQYKEIEWRFEQIFEKIYIGGIFAENEVHAL